MSSLLLATHLFATLALVGLIWTIQLVHYPLMAKVRSGFARYHELHTTRITWIVAPLMGAEALTAIALVGQPPEGVTRNWAWLGLALVALVWLATALLSVPQHARLTQSRDELAIARLVRSNWVRTAAWTARGVLVLWMASRGYGAGT